MAGGLGPGGLLRTAPAKCAPQPWTLNPAPEPLHPNPCTRNPAPETLHPNPCTRTPQPLACALESTPCNPLPNPPVQSAAVEARAAARRKRPFQNAGASEGVHTRRFRGCGWRGCGGYKWPLLRSECAECEPEASLQRIAMGPSTLNLHPAPCTLRPAPCTPKTQPRTPNPGIPNRNPEPCTAPPGSTRQRPRPWRRCGRRQC